MKGTLFVAPVEFCKFWNLTYALFCSFSVINQTERLDRIMQSLRLPNLIRRNLRPLSEREYYHAYEWKFILLFVAYPLLKDILPIRYIPYFCGAHIICPTFK